MLSRSSFHDFAGATGEKNYYELSQKFAHVLDLHYVPHKKAFCDLDENGDVRSIVEIKNLPKSSGPFDEFMIVASRQFLDNYLNASHSIAVRVFDFTRFDNKSFSGWGDGRNETKREDAEFAYNLTIQPGVGSYLRGVQIIHPAEAMPEFHYRLTHKHEAKQYESFMALDWKNGVIREISCAPGATSNYSTKSELPYEVTPAFFRPEVLRRYKSDPAKYALKERSIECRGTWSLQSYDVNDEGQVHAYLVHL